MDGRLILEKEITDESDLHPIEGREHCGGNPENENKHWKKIKYPLPHVTSSTVVGQKDPDEQKISLLLPTSAQIFAPPQV